MATVARTVDENVAQCKMVATNAMTKGRYKCCPMQNGRCKVPSLTTAMLHHNRLTGLAQARVSRAQVCAALTGQENAQSNQNWPNMDTLGTGRIESKHATQHQTTVRPGQLPSLQTLLFHLRPGQPLSLRLLHFHFRPGPLPN